MTIIETVAHNHWHKRTGRVVLALLACWISGEPGAARAQAAAVGAPAGAARPQEASIPSITLVDVLRAARRDPPAVKQAFAALERAEAERSAAKGAWIPALTAEGSLGYAANDQLVYPDIPRLKWRSFDVQGTAALEWSAFDLARGANISARGADAKSQHFASLAAQRAAVALAAELYVRAGAASELIGDARLSLERRTRQHQAISELVSSGNRSPVDAERAKVEMLSAKYVLAMRESDERAAFSALAVAMGRPANRPVRPATHNASFPAVAAAASAEQAMKLALKNREDLEAAAWAVAALRDDYNAALLERLPTLGVQAHGVMSNSQVTAGEGIEGSQYTASVGAFVRWHGLDPAVLFRASVADAAALQAEQDYELTKQNIGADAVAAFHALTRAKLQRERAIEVLRAAQLTREAQLDRYRVGVGSLLELLDAENLEQSARQGRIEAERDEAIAAARLLATCGLMFP